MMLCPRENMSVNLDIPTQLFYLTASMLRSSCGTVMHVAAGPKCPIADGCMRLVSHSHLESPDIPDTTHQCL